MSIRGGSAPNRLDVDSRGEPECPRHRRECLDRVLFAAGPSSAPITSMTSSRCARRRALADILDWRGLHCGRAIRPQRSTCPGANRSRPTRYRDTGRGPGRRGADPVSSARVIRMSRLPSMPATMITVALVGQRRLRDRQRAAGDTGDPLGVRRFGRRRWRPPGTCPTSMTGSTAAGPGSTACRADMVGPDHPDAGQQCRLPVASCSRSDSARGVLLRRG
jgi:hypothetical protein